MRKIALIGGDSRQIHAAETLKKAGFLPFVYGNDGAAKAGFTAPYTMEETLTDATAVILPIPCVKQSGILYAPHTEGELSVKALEKAIPRGATVFVWDREKCQLSIPNTVVDLAEDENLLQENARTTAEAALSLAQQQAQCRFSDMRVTVTGYGRIAKELCRLLSAVGAAVTVVARSEKSRREAASAGLCVRSFAEKRLFSDADLIFNTIPAPILTEKSFDGTPQATPYLELASAPGGIAPKIRAKIPCRMIACGGLPGKICSRSAGKSLAEAVLRHLEVNL